MAQFHTGNGDNIGGNKINTQKNMGDNSTYIENQTIIQADGKLSESNTLEGQKNDLIHIWIVSTIKDNYLTLESSELNNHIPHDHYHNSDVKEWIPFKTGESIATFISEYKSKVSFAIQERFLGNNPLEKEEEVWLFKNLKKVILVIDPLAMHETHIETISHFNTHGVGGCLALVCHCISYELFAYLRTQIEQNLNRLQTCFLDYSEKYIHFVFPISTKEMFFRSLTNIAMVHIKVSTKMQGADEKHSQNIRKQNFTFSI